MVRYADMEALNSRAIEVSLPLNLGLVSVMEGDVC